MARSSFIHRALAAPLGLVLGVSLVGAAFAQEASDEDPVDSSDEVLQDVVTTVPIISTSADGAFVESTAGVNPVAEGGGGTLIYGDISGGLPAVPIVNSPAPAQPGNRPPREPSEPAPAEPAPSEPAPAEPAPLPAPPAPSGPPATSASDQDGDAINDADEPALGLDPSNIDTDGDFIDDGYELNGLGTDPTVFDTDGDGRGDGEEVYGTFTNPLVPDGPATGPAPAPASQPAPVAQPAPAPAAAPVSGSVPISIPGASGPISATEGDASTHGPGAAEADPGTISSPTASEQPVPLTAAAPFAASRCADYGSWYDAQIGYERAGRLTAPAGVVNSLDPDSDGIACEEDMI